MRKYLYISLICYVMAVWVVIATGCSTVRNKILFGDCWEVSVTNALPYQKKGYDCEIWFGIKQHSWKHTEASVIIEGERYWLIPVGRHGSMAQKQLPKGFEPVWKFKFWDFVHYMYEYREQRNDHH